MEFMNSRLIKSLAVSLALFSLTGVSAGTQRGRLHRRVSQKVYVCTGPRARVYHRTASCSGLSRCSGSIVSVSLAKAKSMGRRACRKCY